MNQEIRNCQYNIFALACFIILFNACKKDSSNNPLSSITDSDGNIYTSVTIGTQVWLVENLRTTRFKDGTPIPQVTDATAWGALSSGGYCWYNNNESSNKTTYGAIYNWQAAIDVCPTGWHLPTDAEWKTLEKSQIMSSADAEATGWRYSGLVGGKLKESGTSHWTITAADVTNSTGFTALPGGDRDSDVGFTDLGNYSFFWSATEDGTPRAWYRRLNNDNAGVHRNSSRKATGYSVRCLKD
jgi:uncharacterized protein (TIGR02145 family)